MADLTRQDSELYRALGQSVANTIKKQAAKGAISYSRIIAKVTAVNTSDGTVSVNAGNSSYQMIYEGIPYTTGCTGIAVGSKVVVETVDHVSICIGVLAC